MANLGKGMPAKSGQGVSILAGGEGMHEKDIVY